MQVLTKVVLSFLFLTGTIVFNFSLFAQEFEGEILFTKESTEDTTFYAYKIKGDKVRVEELDSRMQLINYLIVNMSDRTILAINPNRKLYVDMPVHPYKASKDTADYKIIITDNYQIIKGYKCYQWRVQNKKENTEIAYWVSKDNFKFFSDFLKIINRAEKSSTYFLAVPKIEGFFPMMSVERSLLREHRTRLAVISIQKKILPTTLFDVPAEFKMFQKN